MRCPPNSVAVPDPGKLSQPFVLADITLKTITPMFGGGVKPGQTDEDMPIRPSAVRGHLRFWWRACNARRFKTLDDMKIEESLLWGSATSHADKDTGPGAIGVRIDIVDEGEPLNVGVAPTNQLFPFPEQQPYKGREDVSFRLRLTLTTPDPTQELMEKCDRAVQQAAWAWVNFGGIGARTRRGTGALQLDSSEVNYPEEIKSLLSPSGIDSIDQAAQQLVETGTFRPEVPSLHRGQLVMTNGSVDAWSVWKQALNPMSDFRQEREIGRNFGVLDRAKRINRPGQSRWPEPSAIRGHFNIYPRGDCGNKHKYKVNENPTGADFPRADLGLPIVIQRLDGDKAIRLEADQKGRTRMASPIILKPMAIWSNGNVSYVPISLLLDAPHVYDQYSPNLKLTRDRNGDVKRIKPLPMSNGTEWPFEGDEPPKVLGVASARDAFMAFVASEWETKGVKL